MLAEEDEELLDGPQESAAPNPYAGYTFGDCELLEEIGRGGMGVIYKARQKSLNRMVALKLLSGGIFAGAEAVRRFRAEAELAGSLQHPNIVRIFEIGEHDGHEYFSMALVEGPSLEGLVGLSGMEPKRAVELASKIARAAQYAHDRGILHRDIKPNNILLDSNIEPYLTDFGIARILEHDSTLTRTDSMLGTPAYMAPEQARGENKNLTVSADVYGLGAVLYYLLTASPPFHGGSTMETVRQLLEQEPRSPSELSPKVDLDLATICLKCLEKEPSRRYASAGLLADDLDRWLRGEPVVARATTRMEKVLKWARRRPAVAALTALLVLVTLAGTVIALSEWSAAEQERKAALAAKNETLRENYFSSIALAQRYMQEGNLPRARQLLLGLPETNRNWEWGRLLSLCYREIASIPAGDPTLPRFAGWTPDGSGLLAQEGNELSTYTFPGVVLKEKAAMAPDKLVISRGGELKLALFKPNGIELTELDGKTRIRALETPLRPLQAIFQEDRAVLVLPGNEAHFFQGSNLVTVMKPFGPPGPYAFSSDGNRLIWRGQNPATRQTTFVILDFAAGKVLAHPSMFATNFTAALPARNGNDFLILRDEGKVEIRAVSRPGEVRTLDLSASPPQGLELSPDGKYLVTMQAGDTFRIWDLQLMREKATIAKRVHRFEFYPDSSLIALWGGENLVRLYTTDNGDEINSFEYKGNEIPSLNFSQDGKFLVITAAGEPTHIYPIVTAREEFVYPLSFKKIGVNAAGTRMAAAHRNGVVTLWNLQTGQLITEQLGTMHWCLNVAFAPEGSLLAVCGADKTARIWDASAMRLEKTLPHQSPVFSCAWLNRATLVTGEENGAISIWNLADGTLLAQTNALHRRVLALSVSAAGQIAAGFEDGAAALFSSDLKTEITLGKHAGLCAAVKFAPGGNELFSGGGDNTIRVWDVSSRSLKRELLASGNIFSLDFSPDGSRLASAATGVNTRVKNPFLQIWDPQTGREIISFPYPSGQITSALFSPNGGELLAGLDAGDANSRSFGIQMRTFPLKDRDFGESTNSTLSSRVEQFARRLRQRDTAGNSGKKDEAPINASAILLDFPKRNPALPASCLDLTRTYNASLKFPWRPLSLWNELGDDLSDLGGNSMTNQGVVFDARGLVVCFPENQAWRKLRFYEEAPAPISVNQKAQKIHLLQATTFPAPNGEAVLACRVDYADGSAEEIPFYYGEEIAAWSGGASCHKAEIGWSNANESLPRQLFHFTWQNPSPEKMIKQITLISKSPAAPFVAAVTLEYPLD